MSITARKDGSSEDIVGLQELILYGIDARPGDRVDPEHLRLVEEFCDWLWTPARHDGPFDFGDPESFTRGMRLIAEILRRRHWRSRAVNIWIERAHMGLRAMLYHLKARVDFGALLPRETTETTVTIPTPNPEVSHGTQTD
ncbi:MAG: hypothetical protein GY953_48995 [bacterium]|nr:hypothetical protein [bacterium]